MMNLNELEHMGLVLPGPWTIIGAILFGIVGWVAYRRGRKTSRPQLTWTGLALMVYPYAIDQEIAVWLIGAVLTGWVYLKWAD
jgi:hypothetical protein